MDRLGRVARTKKKAAQCAAFSLSEAIGGRSYWTSIFPVDRGLWQSLKKYSPGFVKV